MDLTQLTSDLVVAETMLAQGQTDEASTLLAREAADAEEYVAANCVTTDSVQWFSFPSVFDRLCYRRVERDPRQLRDVGEPLDRLYADFAFALVQQGDYDRAAEALKQAIRWNPMGCSYRLDLADLCRIKGNLQEWLGLSFSVFERAADAVYLVRAFVNFATYFSQTGQDAARAAALAAALRFGVDAPGLKDLVEQARGTDADPANLDDAQVEQILAQEGLPDGANAEVAVCLLMCATDAAATGDKNLATNLTIRARGLVGEAACKALLQLIHETDGEMAKGAEGEPGGGSDGR